MDFGHSEDEPGVFAYARLLVYTYNAHSASFGRKMCWLNSCMSDLPAATKIVLRCTRWVFCHWMCASKNYGLVRCMQVQQHSQLEGFRQVDYSRSGCAAGRWAETKLHATAPRLSGEAQGVRLALPAIHEHNHAGRLGHCTIQGCSPGVFSTCSSFFLTCNAQ